MFEKRHVSLKRLSAKQTRPVQHVAPRPESSPKQPSAKSSQRTAGSQQRECQLIPPPRSLLCHSQSFCDTVGDIKSTVCFIAFVCFLSALARRASENSNSGKPPAEVDLNKKKSTRKAKAGIKVEQSLQHTETAEWPKDKRSQVQKCGEENHF